MKSKRVLAWIGIIALLALYAVTLISACIQSSLAAQLFHASLFATVVIPVFIYVVQMITKYLAHRGEEDMNTVDKDEQ